MSVADILSKLAENAGRTQLQRGALVSGALQDVASLPSRYMDDRARAALVAQQQARLNEDQQFKRDDRAHQAAKDEQQAAKDAAEAAREQNVREVYSTLIAPSVTDPTKWDLNGAVAKAQELGVDPQNVINFHNGKQPGPPKTREIETVDDLGKPIRKIVPDVAGASYPVPPKEPTKKGLQTEKFRLDGKDVMGTFDPDSGHYQYNGEDVTARAKPIPAASIQILNQTNASAKEPASPVEKAIANYMLPPISPRQMATPAGKVMMDHILTENPEYDASKFSVRAPLRKAYSTGPQGQQIASLNTAIEHLDLLQAAADALKNGEFKPGNALFNKVKDTFGSAAPTTFDTIKEKVDKELDAVASKGVPTVSGAAAQKEIGGKASSPEAIKGYIDTSISLLGSSLNALVTPYKREMGEKDPFKPLTKDAEDILVKRGFDPTTLRKTGSDTAATAPDLTGLTAGHGRTFTDGPYKGQTWTIGADGKPKKVS
jgi:hypothetical protein